MINEAIIFHDYGALLKDWKGLQQVICQRMVDYFVIQIDPSGCTSKSLIR